MNVKGKILSELGFLAKAFDQLRSNAQSALEAIEKNPDCWKPDAKARMQGQISAYDMCLKIIAESVDLVNSADYTKVEDYAEVEQ